MGEVVNGIGQQVEIATDFEVPDHGSQAGLCSRLGQTVASIERGSSGVFAGGLARVLLLAVEEHLLQCQEGQEASDDPQPQLLLSLQTLPFTTCRGSTGLVLQV